MFENPAQAQDIFTTRCESFINSTGDPQTFAPQDATTRKHLSDFSGSIGSKHLARRFR